MARQEGSIRPANARQMWSGGAVSAVRTQHRGTERAGYMRYWGGELTSKGEHRGGERQTGRERQGDKRSKEGV